MFAYFVYSARSVTWESWFVILSFYFSTILFLFAHFLLLYRYLGHPEISLCYIRIRKDCPRLRLLKKEVWVSSTDSKLQVDCATNKEFLVVWTFGLDVSRSKFFHGFFIWSFAGSADTDHSPVVRPVNQFAS